MEKVSPVCLMRMDTFLMSALDGPETDQLKIGSSLVVFNLTLKVLPLLYLEQPLVSNTTA